MHRLFRQFRPCPARHPGGEGERDEQRGGGEGRGGQLGEYSSFFDGFERLAIICFIYSGTLSPQQLLFDGKTLFFLKKSFFSSFLLPGDPPGPPPPRHLLPLRPPPGQGAQAAKVPEGALPGLHVRAEAGERERGRGRAGGGRGRIVTHKSHKDRLKWKFMYFCNNAKCPCLLVSLYCTAAPGQEGSKSVQLSFAVTNGGLLELVSPRQLFHSVTSLFEYGLYGTCFFLVKTVTPSSSLARRRPSPPPVSPPP